MSYNFDYMDEKELESVFQLIDPGVYNFEVLKSTRKTSKSGNPMAEIQIKIWDKGGRTQNLFDYLVFNNVALCRRKVKHFCDSVGLQKEYEKCSLPEDLARLSGKVELGIKDEEPNPSGGYYPKKNVVVDYVMTDQGAVKVPLASNNNKNVVDDDIPF